MGSDFYDVIKYLSTPLMGFALIMTAVPASAETFNSLNGIPHLNGGALNGRGDPFNSLNGIPPRGTPPPVSGTSSFQLP